jgi:hypothetical protein
MSADRQSDTAKPTRARGSVRVIECRVDHSPTTIAFDIIVEDADGQRWKTTHDVFRFEMEPISE